MRKAALVAVAVVVVLAGAGVAYALLAPPPHLSAYRNGPDDLGELRLAIEGLGYGTIALGTSPHALSALGVPTRTLVFAAGVEVPYRPGELDALEEFVEDGGSLLVADDFGYANLLADRFGVNFDKLTLFDENFHGNASLVTVRARLADRDYAVVLNQPTALGVRNPNATILATTSEKAYLDANANGRKDDEDVQGAVAVAVLVPRGDGRVVFVGDPAIFTNAMLPVGDNREFALDLVAALLPADGGVVAFDESRHARGLLAAGPAAALEGLVVASQEPAFRALALASVALAVGLWLRLRRREEPFGHHVGRLDDPVRPPSPEPYVRLAALARARVAAVHNLPPDAAPEALRQAAEDAVVGRLAAGDDGLNTQYTLDQLLQRVDAYGRRAPATAADVYGKNV